MKHHYIINILLAAVLLFMPIKASLIAAMLLTGLDLVSGILAAKKRKEPITSSGLKRTVVKILVYEVCIMLAYLVERYLTQGFLPACNIATSFVGITELKSVLENIEDIAGMPILKMLISKIAQEDTLQTEYMVSGPTIIPPDEVSLQAPIIPGNPTNPHAE